MKISFDIKNSAVRNLVGLKAQKHNQQIPLFSNVSDVFVKSLPFKGNTDEQIRQDVIDYGVDGIISCLTLYANPCTSARGHRMPTHEDFDYCMELFFPLCCCASSTYATKDGDEIKYPNQDEFVEIIKTLWVNSEGDEGADESIYLDKNIVRLDESGRMYHMYDFIKDDMARAMNAYSQNRYGTPLKNLDDVKDFALKIYDDDTVRTIKPWISVRSNAKIKRGKLSKYAKELANMPNSQVMINYLLSNKDRFFSSPMSLRARYEDSKPVPHEPIFKEGNPYEDNRTDAEKAIDQMIGMPW